MPENKNAIRRYKILDGLLSDRHHYYDVNDMLDICLESLGGPLSRRTIEKDLEFLSGVTFHAPIVTIVRSGRRCKVYKDPGFSIFNKVVKPMSEEESDLLAAILQTVGQFDGLPTFESLDRLKNSLGINEGRKIISFAGNPYLANTNMLAGLFSVISNRQVIKLWYRPGYGETKGPVLMSPYLLKQYNDAWFLFGALEDGFIMNQPVDRIERFVPMPELKYAECPSDLEERFEDIVGVTLPKGSSPEHILVWATDQEAARIEAKPIHDSQVIIRGAEEERLRSEYPRYGGEGRFISYSCIPNFELESELISRLDGLVVLQPSALREDIKDRLRAMNERYSE